MKEHEKISDDMLIDYIDGNLSPVERNFVEAHMHLPDIPGRLKELDQVNSLLDKHFITAAPSADFSVRVMQQVTIVNNQTAKRNTIPPLMVFFLAVAVLLTGVLFSYSGIPQLDIRFSTLEMNIHLENLFYGTLLLLLLASLWLLDRVWIQRFFKNDMAS